MTLQSATNLPLEPAVIGRYRIVEELLNGAESRVCRARDTVNGQPLILKIWNSDALADGGLAGYKSELDALQAISGKFVVRCLGLEQVAGFAMLVFEDSGGRSLHDIMGGRPLPLRQALHWASKIAAGLNEIHAAHVIHQDINPRNIVINETTGDLKIIDFGAASRLSQEQRAIIDPGVLAGTLTYLSPEQTGRVNRAIDYRCDFYSLGATLYEMLAGRPPFIAGEPLDLVHLHIAKQPTPPRDIDADIPQVVSDIVLRLLAKSADDRYQSAFGIKADLDECLKRLDETGAVAAFPLARRDRSHHFRIPQKLYGRDEEIARLLHHFARVANGAREIVLVSGYPGIGKTALVHEIYRPITERRGYFVSGKFNQFRRNTPFEPLFDALRELIQQVLTENEERIGYWRTRLRQALGSSGQLVIDVLPEIELIIGPQPAVPRLGAAEAQNRMNLVFGNFIGAFCSAEHPLVLLLEDLQWIDSSSLALLLHLLEDNSIRHLMIVGTFRDNEVDHAHPVTAALENYKTTGGAVETLTLEPLTTDDVKELVADALHCGGTEAAALAELVALKTDGNPFFIEEFLKSLYVDGLLSFDSEGGCWCWDLKQIGTQQITDNVVDLMAAKLERLSPATKQVLSLAACLGRRFSLHALAMVCRQSPSQTLAALRQALEMGLVDAFGAPSARIAEPTDIADRDASKLEYQFAHDRFQEAAYALIPAADKPAVHQSIGEIVLENTAADALDQNVFTIVSHVKLGITALADDRQLTMLAELTLRLAKTARNAGATETAYTNIKSVIDLLPERYWETAYALTFELYAAGAQAAQASGKYEEMERLCRVAMKHATRTLDKVQIYEIEAAADYKRTRFTSVISRSVEALELIGFRLPAKPSALDVLLSRLRLKLALLGKRDEDLIGMRGAPDPVSLARLRLSVLIEGAAYWTNPELLVVNNFETIRAAVRNRQQLGAGRLAAHGMILNRTLGDTDGGFRYGALALRAANQPGHEQERARVYGVYYANIHHWKRPARESLPGMLQAYHYGLESGQLIFAAVAALGYCYMSFHCGKPLAALDEEFTQYDEVIKRKLQCLSQYDVNALYHQTLLNLLGKNTDPCALSGVAGHEADLLHRLETTEQFATLHTYYFLKHYLAFQFGRYEEAVQFADRARKFVRFIIGTLTVPVATFYDSLARLAACPTAGPRRRRSLLRQVRRNQKKLNRWAQQAPANHRHKFLLVQAELARTRGRQLAALDSYEQAIHLAHENEYIQEEALANELAGKFHLARGTTGIGVTYLRRAISCYRKWGAHAKAEHLSRMHPELVSVKDAGANGKALAVSGPVGVYASNFDLRTLVKALRGIAEERSHSQLLQKTLLTAMEVAGADAGALVLRKSMDRYFVEAEVSMDNSKPRILQSIPLEDAPNVCEALVNYVKRTRKSVVINDAQQATEAMHGADLDPYVRRTHAKSMLCMPLIVEGAPEAEQLIGLLYLENKQASDAFDEQRIETLGIICLSATGRLELSRKAMTDGLTSLYNHDTFQSLLLKEFSASRRSGRPLSMVMIDIDHFKTFNDQWGHQLGDAVLIRVADVVKSACRQSDVVARYGGEELGVILPDTDGPSALIVAERIRANIEACDTVYDGTTVKVTVSLGVATTAANITSTESLIKLADAALYVSKAAGRNRISVK